MFEKRIFEELVEGDIFVVYDPEKYDRNTTRYSLIRFTKISPTERSEPRPYLCNATASNSSSTITRGFFPPDRTVWRYIPASNS